MRAARVLDMLMVLQRRGRLTARELGAALEVSERTILRDVEALSEAGVPIYTSRGSGGGIELLDGFQTRLTGLTTDEAECLFLIGQPRVAHRLGLSAATRNARHKLSNAIPETLAVQADVLSTWFVHDPDPWTGHRIRHGELRRIARSIRAHRRVELHLTHGSPLTVEPLGLVLKAGSWLVVVTGAESERVICLDDLLATRLTTQRFEPPPTFSVSAFWDAHVASSKTVPRTTTTVPLGGEADLDVEPTIGAWVCGDLGTVGLGDGFDDGQAEPVTVSRACSVVRVAGRAGRVARPPPWERWVPGCPLIAGRPLRAGWS